MKAQTSSPSEKIVMNFCNINIGILVMAYHTISSVMPWRSGEGGRGSSLTGM